MKNTNSSKCRGDIKAPRSHVISFFTCIAPFRHFIQQYLITCIFSIGGILTGSEATVSTIVSEVSHNGKITIKKN